MALLKKKKIFIFGGAGLALVAAVVVALVLVFVPKKGFYVAFYGLESQTVEALENKIRDVEPKSKFVMLDDSSKFTKVGLKDYSLVLMPKGKLADSIKKSSDELAIPESAYLGQMPKQFEKMTAEDNLLPIMLDGYLLNVYDEATRQLSLKLGKSQSQSILKDLQNSSAPSMRMEDFEEYSNISRQFIQEGVGYLAAGKEDENLLEAVSAFAMSWLGTKGYVNLIGNFPLEYGTAMDLPESFRNVLDRIRSMQTSGAMLKKWYLSSEKDLENFMNFRQLSAFSAKLSQQRNMNLGLVNRFTSIKFPDSRNVKDTGCVANVVCGVYLRKSETAEKALSYLTSQAVQEKLGDELKLAPVHNRAQAFDIQADDVRFYAAASAGVLPFLSDAVCANARERQKLAKVIRVYLQ